MIKVLILSAFVCFSSAFAGQKIKFATVDWPPYYGHTLKNDGFYGEITKEAFKKVGYDVEITYMPWARALTVAKNGEYDGLLGAYFSDERAKDFEFSTSISVSEICLFALKEKNLKYEQLSDLYTFSIGTINGFTYSKEFDGDIRIKKDPVTTIEQNIQKLLAKRVDMLIEDKNVFNSEISKMDPKEREKIVLVGKPVNSSQIFNTITKKNPDAKKIIEDFNRGLGLIKADGTFNKIIDNRGF